MTKNWGCQTHPNDFSFQLIYLRVLKESMYKHRIYLIGLSNIKKCSEEKYNFYR